MIRMVLVLLCLVCQLGWAQNAPSDQSEQAAADMNTLSNGDETFELAPQVDYIYDPTGKKDPFKPYKAPRIRGDNRPSAPSDPLLVLDVNQLKLVAVLWNIPKPRAVVKDQQGKSYLLFKNMRIGRNEGVVVDIREGEIVIVEKFDDGFGNTVREARILEMQIPQPGNTPVSAGG